MKLNPIILLGLVCLGLFTIFGQILHFPNWAYSIFILSFVNFFALYKYHLSSKPVKETNETTLQLKMDIKDLEMAKRVQQALLDIDLPGIKGINIAKRCIPASNLGGDFYNFISKSEQTLSQKPKIPGVIEYIDKSEQQVGVVIGDVAGHGVSSALVMALSSGLLGKIGQTTKSPATVLKRANDDIRKFIESSHISHLTVFYGVINTETYEFTYSNAGHHATLLMHSDSSIEELEAEGILLGMFPDEEFEEKSASLRSGDRLILYTDGIIECKNSNYEEYGLERLKQCLRESKEKPINKQLEIIYEEVALFSGSVEAKDDKTLIIIEID
jgi:phosphoserine phosphatase RsbU/P